MGGSIVHQKEVFKPFSGLILLFFTTSKTCKKRNHQQGLELCGNLPALI